MKTKINRNESFFYSSDIGNLFGNSLLLNDESPSLKGFPETKRVKGEIKFKYYNLQANLKTTKEQIKNLENKVGRLQIKEKIDKNQGNTYFLCFIKQSIANKKIKSEINIYYVSVSKEISKIQSDNILDIHHEDLSEPDWKLINNHFDGLKKDMKEIICGLP